MSTPFTIPHTTENIASAITKVVNRQTSGTLLDDNNLAENTVIKSYFDTALSAATSSYPFALHQYNDIATLSTSTTLSVNLDNDYYNLTTRYISPNGDDDGVAITNSGTYYISFNTTLTSYPTLTTNSGFQIWIDNSIYYEADLEDFEFTYPNSEPNTISRAITIPYTQATGGSVVRIKFIIASGSSAYSLNNTYLNVLKVS